jgi:hypothetical protein
VKRVSMSRRDHAGLLRRPPPLDPRVGPAVTPVQPRRVDEVRQLLQLVDRSLLSEEEFERQVLKVFGMSSAADTDR